MAENTKSAGVALALRAEVARADEAADFARDARGHRYEAIMARFPSSGRYAYGYQGVQWNRIYEIFQDMIDKDPHLASVIETRRKAVTARSWEVAPAGVCGVRGAETGNGVDSVDSVDGMDCMDGMDEHGRPLKGKPRASEDRKESRRGARSPVSGNERKLSEAGAAQERNLAVAEFVREVLRNIPDFELALKQLLGAVAFGWSVSEIIWQRRSDGRIGIEALKGKWPGRFYYNSKNELYYKSSRWDVAGVAVPARKFLVAVFQPEHDNPYGVGLCLRAFWYWWFKKNALRFWNIFNEKFGSPLAVARHPLGASEEVRNRLKEVLEALQNDTGVVLEEGQAIEFVHLAGALGRSNNFQELAEFCNREISKLFIGSTLSVGEARAGGSLAQARVHEQVRSDYLEDDARMLMSVVNSQLVRWIVDVNFGEDAPAPRFVIKTEEQRDLNELTRMIQESVRMGLRVPLGWIYESLGIPQPAASERTLRYDDQNLFQYHLQWGILTINEVRESMGLAPLAHGDVPPNPLVVKQLAELGLLRLPEPGVGVPQLSAQRVVPPGVAAEESGEVEEEEKDGLEKDGN